MSYKWSCADCANLDKSRKKWNDKHYCFLYGCNKKDNNGYVCGWIIQGQGDRHLKEMGCSDFREEDTDEQLSLF